KVQTGDDRRHGQSLYAPVDPLATMTGNDPPGWATQFKCWAPERPERGIPERLLSGLLTPGSGGFERSLLGRKAGRESLNLQGAAKHAEHPPDLLGLLTRADLSAHKPADHQQSERRASSQPWP
ncbi:MAG: hypothetical protein EBT08_06635, partial [Betaproteobacteria bacterium]|nr:hypothetical protein [Betaproteobacteria bacterium]